MEIQRFVRILIGLLCIEQIVGIEIEKELTLTKKEKQALDKFKPLVEHLLVEPYMKSDLYLIRWLRARNLNLTSAEEMLKANLKWRKEEKMDTILEEDWSQFASDFPTDDTGTDYSGRPIMAANIAEWDVRRAVLSGQADKVLRFMLRSVESVASRVRKLQSQGKNVTQWQVILNIDNFSLIQHGCIQCLPIYVRFIIAHENYYPNGADKIIAINTPAIFEVVLQLVRPVMTPAMRDSLVVLGSNKNEWKKTLLSLVPADQLPRHFGGTKLSNN